MGIELPDHESLRHELVAAGASLAKVQKDIIVIHAFILQQVADGVDIFPLELKLQSLESLKQSHEWDCRRIRKKIASML